MTIGTTQTSATELLDHDKWYRIEVVDQDRARHIAVNNQLRELGYDVLANFQLSITWITSRDPRDELMLPLRLSGCSVTWYEDMTAALNSNHHRDFDHLHGG